MEKREPSYTIGGNVNWYNSYGEQYEVSLESFKKKKKLPYDTAIPHLLFSREKENLKRPMHPNVHCGTIYKAKTWKQPKSPLTDTWIKKRCGKSAEGRKL